MISESWFAIDSDDSPLRNRKITTVMLTKTKHGSYSADTVRLMRALRRLHREVRLTLDQT